MDLLAQLLFEGLVRGAYYATIGAGFALFLAVSGTWHFAHAAVFVIGGYATYWTTNVLGIPLLASIAIATIIMALAGYAFEFVIYAPLRERSGDDLLMLFIASLMGLLFVVHLIELFFGTTLTIIAGSITNPRYEILGVRTTRLDVIGLVGSVLTLLGLALVLLKTRFGQAVRALASNAKLAAVVGVESSRYHALAMLVASAMLVVPVSIIGLKSGLRPGMGVPILLIAVVAAVVGGLGSIHGAVVAGVAVGILEKIVVWQLSTQWQTFVAFAVLVIIQIVKPAGLFGQKSAGTTVA